MVQSLNTEGLYWSRTTLAGTTTTQDTAAGGGGAVKGGTQRWVQEKNLSARREASRQEQAIDALLKEEARSKAAIACANKEAVPD